MGRSPLRGSTCRQDAAGRVGLSDLFGMRLEGIQIGDIVDVDRLHARHAQRRGRSINRAARQASHLSSLPSARRGRALGEAAPTATDKRGTRLRAIQHRCHISYFGRIHLAELEQSAILIGIQ